MNSLLYIIALILVIGWLVGYFALSLGGIIHWLLILALVAVLLRLIRGQELA